MTEKDNEKLGLDEMEEIAGGMEKDKDAWRDEAFRKMAETMTNTAARCSACGTVTCFQTKGDDIHAPKCSKCGKYLFG